MATESTNGLFHVEYDPDALALVSVNPGSVLNRYDTSTAGKIRMGYADANEINGIIANLVFRYTPGDEAEETDLDPVRGGRWSHLCRYHGSREDHLA